MKKSLSLLISQSGIFLFLLLNIIRAQERVFKAGISGGLCSSQVSGDTYSGFNKLGLNGGAFVQMQKSPVWGLRMEINYIQKGSRHIPHPEKFQYDYYLLKLNYMEICLHGLYQSGKFLLMVGPSFCILVNQYEENQFQNLTGIRSFNKYELSADLGLSYPLLSNFSLLWRYSGSITPIRAYVSGGNRTFFDRGQYNSVLCFSLLYRFEQKTSIDSQSMVNRPN